MYPKGLAESDNAAVIQTVILDASIKKMRSDLKGGTLYELRTWEKLADDFAARHGAGKDLAVGLDKMYRTNFNKDTVSTPIFFMLESLKVGGFILTAVMPFLPVAGPSLFLLPVSSIMACFINPFAMEHEPPKVRLESIKNQLIQALKSKDLNKKKREILLEDVKIVESLIGKLKERSTVLEGIWKLLNPNARKQLRQVDLQRDLEKLAHNDLFEKAAKFQNLV